MAIVTDQTPRRVRGGQGRRGGPRERRSCRSLLDGLGGDHVGDQLLGGDLGVLDRRVIDAPRTERVPVVTPVIAIVVEGSPVTVEECPDA